MKFLPLFVLLALAGLPSCDKVRTLAGQLAKKPANPAAGPQTGEIPKGIREMWSGPSNRIVLVDFYADWCGPCRQLSPVLEKLAAENPGTVQVCKINVDKHRELSAQQGVSSIPDVRIFVDGKLADQFVGAPPEAEVRRKIQALVQHLPPPPPAVGAAGAAGAAGATPKPAEPAIRPMTKDWMPPGIQRR